MLIKKDLSLKIFLNTLGLEGLEKMHLQRISQTVNLIHLTKSL